MVFVFDLDDTLYDLMSSFRRTHEELFASRVDVSCEELFYASRKYNKEAFELWNQGKLTKTEEFDYRIRKSYEQYGCELNAEELEAFRIKYRNYQNEIHLMDGIEDIFELLENRGMKKAILTNGNHNDQWKKIKALRLDKVFKDIFVSEDLAAPKPERAAFEAVEIALNAEGEMFCYIGDTFDVDIVGAYHAGWKSIWFNHRRKDLPEGEVKPDYTVYSVSEMQEVIRELCEKRR